jgi:hypothetical protein
MYMSPLTSGMLYMHRDTVMRLMVEVGTGCEKIIDEQIEQGIFRHYPELDG